MGDSVDSIVTLKGLMGEEKYPDTYFIPEPALANIPIVHLDATPEVAAPGSTQGLMSGYDLHVSGSPDANHITSAYPAGSYGTAAGVGAMASGHVTGTLADYLSHSMSGDNTVHASGAGVLFNTLDDAVYALKLYIEQQLLVIKNLPDEKLQSLLHLSEQGHAASCAQILKENYMLGKHKINIFENFDSGPLGVLAFVQGLPMYGTETGYGRMGDYLERIASDDIYGDAIKATLRQGKNAMLLSELGVNTEVFNLPHSTYYRDPAEMYRQAYTGSLPITPMYQQDQVLPLTDADVYIELRNQMLIENGYDPFQLLPAQADEIYMDLKAMKADPSAREALGLALVKEAVDRNIKVIGNTMNVVGLNGTLYPVANIHSTGLELLDNNLFVDTMLGILNKMLYGNIGTTKFDNPYNTDQMIYGMLEMLAQVTPDNIDALKNTLLGQFALPTMLDKIKTALVLITGKLNTGQDRNDPHVWGDAGSGADIKLTK